MTMANSCVNTPEESSFYLKLNYSRRERSKDSNHQTTNITIKNRIIEYSATHGGRHARPNITKEFKLTEEAENKLVEYLRNHKLNQNIKENIDNVSPGINVDLSLEINIGEITTKSEVSGAVKVWGSKEYVEKQNKQTIKNKDYYNEIHSLLVFMKSKLGFKEIEI